MGAGSGGRGSGGSQLPQVEEDVGLLVQNHLDVAGVDQGVIHLVPLSIACLKQQRVRTKTNDQHFCDAYFFFFFDASFFYFPSALPPTLGDGCTHLSISEHKTKSKS